MNKEVVYFRLALLVSGISLAGCGTYSAYSFYQEEQCKYAIDNIAEQIRYCDERKSSDDDCREIVPRSYQKERLVQYRDSLNEQGEFFGLLAFLISSGTLLLFYALRWVFLGKVKPFWIRET